MPNKLKIIFLTTLVTSVFLTLPLPLLAAENCPQTAWLKTIGIKEGRLIPCACITSEIKEEKVLSCGVTEMFQTIVNFTQILLALTGSAALLMIIYGGTMMILAGAGITGTGDNKKNINLGKDAIQAAIIGLAIILGAWLIVNTTIAALTQGKVSGQSWLFEEGLRWNVESSTGSSEDFTP
ncbi:MAG: hypothetical protein WC675_04250 [Patescibacteria group bacterium]|jgi:hypothetical protein